MITVQRRLERGGLLDVEDLDLATAFADHPLDPLTLRCLRYMHDIESHTVCYLRDVLVTRAHTDPILTDFLTTWNYEEHWHGEALGRVLKAHGEPAGAQRVADLRAAKRFSDRVRPLAFIVGSAVLPDITAVQMAWGAINEWTTQAGYARLAVKADHAVLTELLTRIMRQEARHIAFYNRQAALRLAASPGAQRVTRFALKHAWSPVGTGVRPPAEVNFVVNHLFAGPDGETALKRIDRRIDQLPGLSELHLLTNARAATVPTK